MKKLLILLLALLCIPTMAFAVSPSIPMVGAEAPDFEITLLNGETFRLSEQRGKVVLINIWATWCGPCVSEMPDINQLAMDYADNLVVIGVNCGESEQTIADFVAQNGYSYLFAADTDYYISSVLYPTTGIPYTIVVDANGIITQLHLGGGAGMYEVLEGYVAEALNTIKTTEQGVQIFA